ncbi:hypothetical protein ZYGR_0P02510 [Zygosaccharomyces rouxii]|uniref:Biogenesis of lysosome-related organelles complex 1 subunit BLI1 n=2 Tax=Zygosaccharomyces rouxii TaxID=4956 RepID=BLI1_ZYGRC|nr:uncharacterized protein ZYRO0E06424g [Zygosaccharomyces rouxii]C5E4I6.1 RecName: Full=Biogenesis of lysosome-related organelles complex 1 subunit BLI1; Short=BLOC-1 subunit BLI1; AltName: Full=BLOC-1 interactor 1 [Zygosaccharomyces rouxii CBS 732]KAH9198195.1 biogenesis of lysosome-related organelles complex 1 subunit BLI1 [Zygosaccharomyces rouxii]GAV49606.1 hypothetical protein ZYGR_0P02510 [Zygosaccharomyces rouxii]CAR30947.1 ZYRO0E06424p [Zygosaccharomyces rouxii]
MRDQERTLNQDVERCINVLQDFLDTGSAKAISVFSNKTSENEDWLEEIRVKYRIKDNDELQAIKMLKQKRLDQLEALESKVDYYEKLCDELEEFQDEMEVKAKLEQNRRSRFDSMTRK